MKLEKITIPESIRKIPTASDDVMLSDKINELIDYITYLEKRHEEALSYLAGTADDAEDLVHPFRKFPDWHEKNVSTILNEKGE